MLYVIGGDTTIFSAWKGTRGAAFEKKKKESERKAHLHSLKHHSFKHRAKWED